MSNAILEKSLTNASNIDEVSCDQEVWEINSKGEGRRKSISSEKSKARTKAKSRAEMRENNLLDLQNAKLVRNSPLPVCDSCRDLKQEYICHKKKMETNLTILKEKIVTTDELIKNYHKKCQENEKLVKKVADLSEKLKKCYGETGAMRIQLEKARQANEPLKKTAKRFEVEKAMAEEQVADLTERLRLAESKLGDSVCKSAVQDAKSSTLTKNLSQLAKENESLKERLLSFQEEKETLKIELKTNKATNRKSQFAAKSADRKYAKLSNKLNFYKEKYENLRRDLSYESPKKNGTRSKTTAKKKGAKKGTRAMASQDSTKNSLLEASTLKVEIGDEQADKTSSEEDTEVANFLQKYSKGALRNVKSPSPPLSPIPPSPVPPLPCESSDRIIASAKASGPVTDSTDDDYAWMNLSDDSSDSFEEMNSPGLPDADSEQEDLFIERSWSPVKSSIFETLRSSDVKRKQRRFSEPLSLFTMKNHADQVSTEQLSRNKSLNDIANVVEISFKRESALNLSAATEGDVQDSVVWDEWNRGTSETLERCEDNIASDSEISLQCTDTANCKESILKEDSEMASVIWNESKSTDQVKECRRGDHDISTEIGADSLPSKKLRRLTRSRLTEMTKESHLDDSINVAGPSCDNKALPECNEKSENLLTKSFFDEIQGVSEGLSDNAECSVKTNIISISKGSTGNPTKSSMHANIDSATGSKEANLLEQPIKTLDMCGDGCELPEAQVNVDVAIKNIESLSKIEDLKDERIKGSTNIDAKAGCFDEVKDIEARPVENSAACTNRTLTEISVSKSTTKIDEADNEKSISNQKENKDIDEKHCMELLNDAGKVASSLESTVVDLNDVCLARDECKVADTKQTLQCDIGKLSQSKELIHKTCVSKDDKSAVCIKPTSDRASENTLTVTKENTICSITSKVSVHDDKAASERVTETKTQLNLKLHDKPSRGISRGNFLDRRSAIIKNDTNERKGEKTTIPLIEQLKHARKTAAGIRNRARNSLLNDIRKQITSSPSKEQSCTDGCAEDGAGLINMIEKSPVSLHQTTSNNGCDKENLILGKTDYVAGCPVPSSDKGNGMCQQAVTECRTAVSGDVCEETNVFLAGCENISVPTSLLHQEDVSPNQGVKAFDTVITGNLSNDTNLMVDRCGNDNMLPISVSQKGSALLQDLFTTTDNTTSGKRIDKVDLNVDACELGRPMPVAVSEQQNVFSHQAAKAVDNYTPDEQCTTANLTVNEADSGKSMPIAVSKQANVEPGMVADKALDTAAGYEGEKQGNAVTHQMIKGCVTVEPDIERCEKSDLAVGSLNSVPNVTPKEKVKRETHSQVKTNNFDDLCSVQSNKPILSKSTESSMSLSQPVSHADGASSIQTVDHTATETSDKVLAHDECDNMKDVSSKVTKIAAQSHVPESIVNATPDRQQSLDAKRYVGYEDTIGESSCKILDGQNPSAATAPRVEDIIDVNAKSETHYQVESCLKIPEAEQLCVDVSSCDAEKNTNRASTEVGCKDNHQQTASTGSAGHLEAGFIPTDISKPDNRTEPLNLNYSGPEHLRTRFHGSRSHRLSTENIIELVSISSLTVSPLPPSPPRQRVTPLLSPLPVTPQPELLSPLCSSPEILSPPTLRDAPSDCLSSHGVFAPKPVAVRPSTTIRALDFKFNENKHSFKRVAGSKSNRNRLLDVADHSDGNTRCRLSDVAVSSASNPSNPSSGRNEQKIAANANTRPRKRSLSSEPTLDIASERAKMRTKDGGISGSRAGKKTRFLENLPEKIDAVKTQESRDNKIDTLKETSAIDQKGTEVGHKKSIKSDKASHNSKESASKTNIENSLTISDRRKNQSEPAYVKYCFASLKNGARLSDVSSKLSVFKNISSSTAVVSAIIAYLKTSDEDLVQSLLCKLNCCSEALCTKDHKLANKVAKGQKNSDKTDQVVNEFTRRPFFTEIEERIVLLVAETEKIQHLSAVSKMLIQLIPRAIFSEEALSDCGLQSLCRMFSSLCRLMNEAEQLRGLIFNVAYSSHLSSRLGVVLLCCFCVWPMIFEIDFSCKQRDINQQSILSSPLSCTIQIIATWIAMKQEQLAYAEALQSIFGWSFTKESGLTALSNSLLAIIGIQGQVEGKTIEHECLQNKLEFDILKSLELVAVHMGWEWCNNYLIAERLWGIFRDWNKGLGTSTSSENDVADATIINAIKLIGCVSRIGISGGHHFRTPKCFTTFMMACIGILQKSQLNSKVSLPVQIAAAYTLVNLSPVNPEKVSSILYAWLQQKVGKDVPHDLTRAAASIAAQNMV